ncbi:MAG: hypothetical protein NVSMB4_14930 [Acidimicrobiales bacterium]
MTDPPRTLSVRAVWGGGYRCEVSARQHRILVDEPTTVGGTDTGSTPTELFLASLGSCFALALGHVAAKRGLELGAVDIDVTGIYDGPSFRSLTLDVRVETPDPDGVDDLLERARKVCYVSNTLAHPPEVIVRRVVS